MAVKEYSIATVGPFGYDDADCEAFTTDGQMSVGGAPTLANHVMRLSDGEGLGSTQYDETAAKVLGTNYQNTLGYAITVMVTAKSDAALFDLTPYSDSVTPAATPVGDMTQEVNRYACVTFKVPPDYYYRVDCAPGNTTLYRWIEWR